MCPIIQLEVCPLSPVVSIFDMSDLNILLYLVKENMSEHKLFKKCLEAQEMAASMKPSTEIVGNVEEIAKNQYLKVLTTIVAWGTEDPSDRKTKEVLAAQRN